MFWSRTGRPDLNFFGTSGCMLKKPCHGSISLRSETNFQVGQFFAPRIRTEYSRGVL